VVLPVRNVGGETAVSRRGTAGAADANILPCQQRPGLCQLLRHRPRSPPPVSATIAPVKVAAPPVAPIAAAAVVASQCALWTPTAAAAPVDVPPLALCRSLHLRGRWPPSCLPADICPPPRCSPSRCCDHWLFGQRLPMCALGAGVRSSHIFAGYMAPPAFSMSCRQQPGRHASTN